MQGDAQTLSVYATEAERYAEVTRNAARDPALSAFLALLWPGARVLDLGCGPAHAAAEMRRRGMEVEAVDASPEMVRLARELHGIEARLAGFDEVEAVGAFDGIWAHFSLLHAPRAEMPAHLARLHRALKPGGVLSLGLKTGEGEGRDRLGRFYTYYTIEEIEALLVAAGFTLRDHDEGADAGLSGEVAPWVVVRAHA